METGETKQAKTSRTRARLLVLVVPLVVAVLATLWLLGVLWVPVHAPLVRAHDGPSDALKRTLVVPTLDTPAPKGKNVIWCGSFQIAWNRLKDDIIKEPIGLKNAEGVAARLNNAKQSEADLPPGSYYAAAGWVAEGIVAKIQQQMARQFPSVPKPTFDVSEQALMAYAYLTANVKFTIPFFESTKAFVFTDSARKRVSVGSFGIRAEDHDAYLKLREQVEILYTSYSGPNRSKPDEFIIDPCRDSKPNRIILACVPPKATLAETLADVEAKTGAWKGDYEREVNATDDVLVPNMFWRLRHRFTELEGQDKILLNATGKGLWLAEASQLIEFKLDRCGAELASEAKIIYKCGLRSFLFNRPFLIIMKKRGAKHPFFVMWVDNAELLAKP